MKLNNSKIVTLLALGGLLTLSPALKADDTNSTAATPPAASNHEKHGGRGFQAQIKSLDLTPDQQPKFKAALQGMMQKFKDLRQDTGLTPADRRAKVKEIRQETNETMKTILTPEQYEKWLKMGPGAQRGHKQPKPAESQ